MADAGFRGADGNIFRVRAGPAIDGGGFGAVVERRAGAVGVDVTDFLRRELCAVACGGHGSEGCVTVWMRLSEMMRVGACAVTNDFAENFRVTRFCAIE